MIVNDLEDMEALDDKSAKVDRKQQIFKCLKTPFFVTLFTESQVEPLYFNPLKPTTT